MKTFIRLLVVCFWTLALVGCANGPSYTSESGFLERLFLPSELESRTKYYEKKGMSNADAMRKAYWELDRGERSFYQSESQVIESREITREDMDRWSKGSR